MLPKPSLVNIPGTITSVDLGLSGCGQGYSGGGTRCETDFSCSKSFSGGCVDSYSSGGGDPWGPIGAALSIVGYLF